MFQYFTLIAVFITHPVQAGGQTLLGAVPPTVGASHATGMRSSKRPLSIHAPERPGNTIGRQMENTLPDVSFLPSSIRDALILQTALDRVGFSPGLIDGIIGPKARTGLSAFQIANGLDPTGVLDPATRVALGVDRTPFVRFYVLTHADRSRVGPCPTDWVARSKLSMLGFQSLASVADYQGHCSSRLLVRLNPHLDIKTLHPGTRVILPNITQRGKPPRATTLEIDFGNKIIRAFDRTTTLVGLFHCSIAREKRHRPAGGCRITSITTKPNYLFKPEGWPEVKGIDHRLVIPPGPRNPVGLVWIGLSIPGYGIHGTPKPELIGKTGSHGCIRLTNWDAQHLASMVKVGGEIRFVDGSVEATVLK